MCALYGTQCIHNSVSVSFIVIKFCALDGWMVNISGLTNRQPEEMYIDNGQSSMDFFLTDFYLFISKRTK